MVLGEMAKRSLRVTLSQLSQMSYSSHRTSSRDFGWLSGGQGQSALSPQALLSHGDEGNPTERGVTITTRLHRPGGSFCPAMRGGRLPPPTSVLSKIRPSFLTFSFFSCPIALYYSQEALKENKRLLPDSTEPLRWKSSLLM